MKKNASIKTIFFCFVYFAITMLWTIPAEALTSTDSPSWVFYLVGSSGARVDGIYDARLYTESSLSIGGYLHSAEYGTRSIVSIGYDDSAYSLNAFARIPGLTSVSINSPVSEISSSAFTGCKKLQTVSFASTVKTIGQSAFSQCTSLRSIIMPGSVTTLGASAFYNCSALTAVELSGGLTALPARAFMNCSSLSSIYIPESVTSIGNDCFSGTGVISVHYGGSPSSWDKISFGTNTKDHLRVDKYDKTNSSGSGGTSATTAKITSFTATATPYTTNAYLSAKAIANAVGKWTKSGIRIYENSTGTLVASKDESHNYSRDNLSIWYNVTDELKVTLKSGTRYRYRFYTVYNGTTSWTSDQYFTTSVATTLNWDNSIEEITENAFTFTFTATANKRGIFSEFGFVLKNALNGDIESDYSNTTDENLNVKNAQFFKINSWTPVSWLSPATSYAYQLYYVFDGIRYTSDWYTFKTRDNTAPSISNVRVTNLTRDGYDVTCTVYDRVGVVRVQCPTWTTPNGQDDIQSSWETNTAASAEWNGTTATFHVDVKDHNYERDCEYNTHIYAYDAAGNYRYVTLSRYIDGTAPIISSCTLEQTGVDQFAVNASANDANSGISRYEAYVWTEDETMDKAYVQTVETTSATTSVRYTPGMFGNTEGAVYYAAVKAYDSQNNVSAFCYSNSLELNNIPWLADKIESVYVAPVKGLYYEGHEFTPDDLDVTICYYDGSVEKAAAYTVSQTGTGVGEQTITVDYLGIQGSVKGDLYKTPDFIMPQSITKVEPEAFRGLSMAAVVCPEGLKEIGNMAFADCNNLEEIYIPDSVTTLGTDIFKNCGKIRILCYSGSAATQYAQNNGISYDLLDERPLIKVYFDANGGEVSVISKEAEGGTLMSALPEPARENYIFTGWFTEPDSGKEYSAGTFISENEDFTLYAHWKEKTVTVSFNGNGGTVSVNSKTVKIGQPLGDLPSPSRNYYSFAGWFTASSGGTQYSADSVCNFTENFDLYAHWNVNDFGSWSDWKTTSYSKQYSGDLLIRDVNTRDVIVGYAQIKEYQYSHYKYVGTNGSTYYTYKQYSGSNYKSGGTWEYYDSGTTPLAVLDTVDGYTRYKQSNWGGLYKYAWFNETVTSRNDYDHPIYRTEYQYRDRIR